MSSTRSVEEVTEPAYSVEVFSLPVGATQPNTLPAQSRGTYLQDVMTGRAKWQFRLLVAAWWAGLALFYVWWFRGEHIASWTRFAVNTVLLVPTLVLPGYFFFFVSRMKRVIPTLEIPRDWRVAMITTRAPSEPFSIVKRTLEAMLDQDFPHDTWLADEAPTPEIYRWCEEHGVQVSSRHGVAEYHRESWPRRTRCKEGNLAYFYDHYGYEQYDIVVQLDADHEPQDGYLEAMLRPFVNPKVGYVSAPSICNKNADSSWSARGRLYSESILHGPLQAGYSAGFAPLCIGSHYAVRTKALREIGGLGPELAEDHSTTLMMNAHGWRGVHALDAIAYGDGPGCLADCITQEFQWSRSLIVILLTVLPKYWGRLPWRLRCQFLFSELWYAVFGGSMLLGTLLPILAVSSGQPWVRVSYFEFLGHAAPVLILSLAVLAFLKRFGWVRPADVPLLNWEVGLFQIVRWPWVVSGCAMGVLTAICRRQTAFRVTPKGVRRPRTLSWKILLPYLAIVLISFSPTLFVRDAGEANGYYFFLLLSQITYITALVSMVLIHFYEVSESS